MEPRGSLKGGAGASPAQGVVALFRQRAASVKLPPLEMSGQVLKASLNISQFGDLSESGAPPMRSEGRRQSLMVFEERNKTGTVDRVLNDRLAAVKETVVDKLKAARPDFRRSHGQASLETEAFADETSLHPPTERRRSRKTSQTPPAIQVASIPLDQLFGKSNLPDLDDTDKTTTTTSSPSFASGVQTTSALIEMRKIVRTPSGSPVRRGVKVDRTLAPPVTPRDLPPIPPTESPSTGPRGPLSSRRHISAFHIETGEQTETSSKGVDGKEKQMAPPPVAPTAPSGAPPSTSPTKFRSRRLASRGSVEGSVGGSHYGTLAVSLPPDELGGRGRGRDENAEGEESQIGKTSERRRRGRYHTLSPDLLEDSLPQPPEDLAASSSAAPYAAGDEDREGRGATEGRGRRGPEHHSRRRHRTIGGTSPYQESSSSPSPGREGNKRNSRSYVPISLLVSQSQLGLTNSAPCPPPDARVDVGESTEDEERTEGDGNKKKEKAKADVEGSRRDGRDRLPPDGLLVSAEEKYSWEAMQLRHKQLVDVFPRGRKFKGW
uniref:Uncharacterized protein n=1 Tax=Chromera velia CCMP2878 TaxID=1169474 RepID=A0A0G4G1S8_9ALVE|eukprot:Cvel_4031.t1-p1 / transcript=Cvel_4031.t1 / gene=Cvel_4031 / organism=Chromera_velia_CCMP2878 / gene_product=hypothetical protein / transcript_product=hypothetical protein / location=Cvel_scaffold171:85397-87864(-) / protein_length=548 / sequence_SO=supercontig / SO=protein_coding / is_pseudo=false